MCVTEWHHNHSCNPCHYLSLSVTVTDDLLRYSSFRKAPPQPSAFCGPGPPGACRVTTSDRHACAYLIMLISFFVAAPSVHMLSCMLRASFAASTASSFAASTEKSDSNLETQTQTQTQTHTARGLFEQPRRSYRNPSFHQGDSCKAIWSPCSAER